MRNFWDTLRGFGLEFLFDLVGSELATMEDLQVGFL